MPDHQKTEREPPTTRRRLQTAGTRITQEEKSALAARAAAAGMTESNYIRLIIQQSLAVSPETRMLMEFACIGEEKVRLLLIAAAKGELGSKEVLEQMETKAIEAGLGKVDRRLRLVRQVVQSKEQSK
ncbi:MAG: plasmid mobilization protein [Bryobacteraceae bacterium]|jgi:hypothetical protein